MSPYLQFAIARAVRQRFERYGFVFTCHVFQSAATYSSFNDVFCEMVRRRYEMFCFEDKNREQLHTWSWWDIYSMDKVTYKRTRLLRIAALKAFEDYLYEEYQNASTY
jgi:hypothetical protein